MGGATRIRWCYRADLDGLFPQMHYRYKSLTQRELNRAYEGPEFELADKYGEHLGVIFVTMLYSSGMPILYLATGLSFFVTYRLEKWYLLQVWDCLKCQKCTL